MGADVQVQPRAVAQEHVGAATPRHHPAEQVAGHLVRTQPPMTVEGARDPELGLDAHNSSLHTIDSTAKACPKVAVRASGCIRLGNDFARASIPARDATSDHGQAPYARYLRTRRGLACRNMWCLRVGRVSGRRRFGPGRVLRLLGPAGLGLVTLIGTAGPRGRSRRCGGTRRGRDCSSMATSSRARTEYALSLSAASGAPSHACTAIRIAPPDRAPADRTPAAR